MKGIKEFLKNWILAHERAYWYIVFGIAIGLFALITAMGVGKLHSAEAAETKYPPVIVDDVFVADIRDLDWSGLAEYFETEYGYTGNIGEKIIREHKYMIIVTNITQWNSGNHGHLWYIFTDEPVQYTDNSNYWLIADGRTDCYFEVSGGVVQNGTFKGYGRKWNSAASFGYDENAIACVIGSGNSSSKTIASTYNYREGQSPNNNRWPHSNIPYPEKVLDNLYDTSAPYIMFDNLTVVNRIADGDTKNKLFDDIYEDYTMTSSWTYTGILKNMSPSEDLSYHLESTFVIELPTDDFILELAEEFDIDLGWERNALNYTPDMVALWNSYTGNKFDTYEITIEQDIVPDENGRFQYSFNFAELEWLLRTYDEDARERFKIYAAEENTYWKAILLSYLHVDMVTSVVKTTRADSIAYGRVCTNLFERGVYDVCLEVIPDVDINTATPEEIDKILQDALDEAHDKYIKDMEDRLEELEGQLGNVGSIGGAFGNLEGTDLWTGFINLVSGLGSLVPAIGSLSSLTGAVFAFLPVTITGIMSTTLFAICIIAIIKAIRG